MPRRRRGRGRQRVNRAPARQQLSEVFRFDVQAGADLMVTPKMLSIAQNRCWRPMSFSIEALGGYVQIGANGGDVPGAIVPVAVQLDLCDPSTHYVASSGVRVIGAVPRRVTIRYPRSGDWYEPTFAANGKIAVISGICLGAVNNSGSQQARIRGVATFVVRYGREAVSNQCPAPTLYSSDDISDDLASSFSGLSV